VQRFREKLLATTLVLASAFSLNDQAANATTGDAAWFQEALTEPFRAQPASGTVDNQTLTWDVAQLQPEKGGMYSLDLMKQVRLGQFHIVRIRFPGAAKLDGQTVTFPLQTPKGDGTLHVFYGGKAKNLAKTCEPKYIYGRITFGKAKGTSLPGYICLHFRNQTIGTSMVNGYFHATQSKVKRRRPTAMFD